MSENRASSRSAYQGDWETPWKDFNIIAESFLFGLDVCATPENSKCQSYITKEEDALVSRWDVPQGYYWWCNPDFRLAPQFLEKAYEEMADGNPGLMLLPPNIETEWFKTGITMPGIRILFYPRRINFLDPSALDGKKRGGNNKGSILAAFSLEKVLPRVAGQPWWRIEA